MRKNHYCLSIGIISFFLIMNSCSYKEKKSLTLEDNYEQILANKINISEVENCNLNLKNQKVFFGNDSLNKISLMNLVSKNKIFFCFSRNTCTPCIEQTVDIIKKIFPDYKQNEKIIFVSPDYDKRFRDNCYGKMLLTLEQSKFGIPIENTEAPFFLRINNRLYIESIHIINNFNFKKTEVYLRELTQKSDFR